jgi:hypothetical protein
MRIFSSAQNDNLPGTQSANRVTTIPATDQSRCYNPDIHGDATVAIRRVDLPDNQN